MPETRPRNSKTDTRLPTVDELLAASDWSEQLARARARRAEVLREKGARRPLPETKPWESEDYLTVARPRPVEPTPPPPPPHRRTPLVLLTPAPPPSLRRRRRVPHGRFGLAALGCVSGGLVAVALGSALGERGIDALTTAPAAPEFRIEALSFVAAIPEVRPREPALDLAAAVGSRPAEPSLETAGGPSGRSPESVDPSAPVTFPEVLAEAPPVARPAIPVVLPPRRAHLAALPTPGASDPYRPVGAAVLRPVVDTAPGAPVYRAPGGLLPVITAASDVEVSRMVLPGLGGTAEPAQGPLRVSLFYPAGTGGDRGESVIEALKAAGFEVSRTGAVDFTVSATNVRYYHASDREDAAWLAGALGGEARDFTGFSPAPSAGTIEVWLKGGPPPGETRSASAAGRDARTIGGLIRRIFGGPPNRRPAS